MQCLMTCRSLDHIALRSSKEIEAQAEMEAAKTNFVDLSRKNVEEKPMDSNAKPGEDEAKLGCIPHNQPI